MKAKHWIPAAFAAAVVLAGCDANQYLARHGMGTMSLHLPACRKFETANWKGEDATLWYTTRRMRPGEIAETHEYQSSTLFGVFEGKVVFVEHACTDANANNIPTEN